MLSGAYSQRYQSAEKHHVEVLKQLHHEASASETHLRSKRLQQDTNRRRRALADKKKHEAEREEKRRQEILTRRRNEIHEATERYQRQNRHFKAMQMQDGLGGVYGARATPALEDALRMVRGSPQYQPGSSTRPGSGRPGSGRPGSGRPGSGASNGSHQHRGASAGYIYAPQPPSGDRATHESAMRAQLQSNSLRNLNSSRSLFEAQLEHTQRQLHDQQRSTLQQFNAAIMKQLAEADKRAAENKAKLQSSSSINPNPHSLPRDASLASNSTLLRTNSVGSVDSLEDGEEGSLEAREDTGAGKMSRNGLMLGSFSDSNLMHYGHGSACGSGDSNDAASNVGNAYQQPATSYINGATYNYHNAPSSPSPVSNGVYTTGSSYANQQPNTTYSGSDFNNGFVLHNNRRGGSPGNVAVVQPQPQSQIEHSNTQFVESKKPPSGYRDDEGARGYKVHPQAEDMRLEDAQETVQDVIDAPVPHTMAVKHTPHPPPHYHSAQRKAVVNYVTTQGTIFSTKSASISTHSSDRGDVGGYSKPPTTKAWGTPSPAVPDPEPSQPKSSSHHISHRSPYGTRSTATNVTMTTQYNNPDKPTPVCKTGEIKYNSMYHQHQYSAGAQAVPSKTPPKPRHASAITLSDSSDEAEQSDDSLDESEEETEDISPTMPRGILKKPDAPEDYNPTEMRKIGLGIRASFISASTGKIPSAVSSNGSGSLRDSIEVTRDQNSRNEDRPEPRKKSVRFSEVNGYSDDVSGPSSLSANTVPPEPPTKKEKSAADKKSARPSSANASSSAGKPSDASANQGRAFSAGSYQARNRAVIAQTNKAKQEAVEKKDVNHNDVNKTPQHNGVISVTVKPPSGTSRIPVCTKSTAKPESTANTKTKQIEHAQAAAKARVGEPVFDANGMRLDRTPTDEEINWLWEKVRTCLSRNNSVNGSTDTNNEVKSNGSRQTAPMSQKINEASRQTAPMSQKFIDGNSLAPHCRTTTRVTSGYVPPNVAKKLTMNNLNSHSQRMVSQQQRSPAGPQAASATPYISSNFLTPSYSNDIGFQNANHTTGYPAEPNVSDSTAAFLLAEKLSQTPVSESHMERTLEATAQRHLEQNSQRHYEPQKKPTSAISMEEQRLLQSLERLNERLKMTENSPASHAQGSFVPRPPAQPSTTPAGGQNQAPMRRYSANTTGGVSRHQYRTGSGNVMRTTSAGVIQPGYAPTR